MINTGKNKRRRLVRNPTVQYIIINLHTKYEYSSLHSFTEIFDENFIIQSMERKKIGQIQGRISRRRLVLNPTIQYIIINLIPNVTTLACTVSQKSLKKKSIIQSMERKKIGQNTGKNKQEKAIPLYNTSLSTCSPNMTLLASTVSQKSLTKKFIIQSMERKKIGQIQGRISRRRLVRNPTIQYIIINLDTKYNYCSLHSFTEIFDEQFHHSKYGKKENWTNTGKNKQEKAGLQSHDTTCHHQSVYQI